MELDLDFKPGSPIWQGDLLGFGDWLHADPLRRYGVIITADCDIQRARPEQELVFLRVVTQADYIDLIWSRSKLERARDNAVSDLTKMVNRLRKEHDVEAAELDSQDVTRWVFTASGGEICDAISLDDARDRSRLIENADRARSLITDCRTPQDAACLDRLIRNREQARPEILKQAIGELSRVRDDVFFVTGITETTDDTGYYVLLDQIGAIQLDQITDSLAEVKASSRRAYRFGRLARVYKYAMAQRFAFLFQRIGLPDGHAERHSESLGRLGAPTTHIDGGVI